MQKIINKHTVGLAIVIAITGLIGCGKIEDGSTAVTSTVNADGSTTNSDGSITNADGSITNADGSVTNAGLVAFKNFSLLASDVQPTVVDPVTGIFTKTDIEMTVYIGDRNNRELTDQHTIRFYTEYGLIVGSCITTDSNTCGVTWSAIKKPDVGGPGDDKFVDIVAVTTGEESFTDVNGNGVFDDADTFSAAQDLEEPYIDNDNSGTYSVGDGIIDVVSTNDSTGANGVHDIADGFFNGPECTHSSLCGVLTSVEIFTNNTLKIDGP